MKMILAFISLTMAIAVYLKLSDVIDLGWTWVLSPIWVPLIIAIGYMIIVLIQDALVMKTITFNNRRKRKW